MQESPWSGPKVGNESKTRRARKGAALERAERAVGLGERERRRRQADGDPRRLRQQGLAVGARVGGDRANLALVEEVARVVERRGGAPGSPRQRPPGATRA